MYLRSNSSQQLKLKKCRETIFSSIKEGLINITDASKLKDALLQDKQLPGSKGKRYSFKVCVSELFKITQTPAFNQHTNVQIWYLEMTFC